MIGDNKKEEVKIEKPTIISINKINYDVAPDQFDPSNWNIGNNNPGGGGANRTTGAKNATTTSQGAALEDDV